LISRRHCQLLLDPTSLKLQDLGSRNGTYLNGKRIESASLALDPEVCPHECQCEHNACAGDLLTIGGTTLRIDVVDCPPKEAPGSDAELWKEGEAAKKDCPVPCCAP
jgi:pSer/pThr/pTyr-binding forkhead associated (FHA) protein